MRLLDPNDAAPRRFLRPRLEDLEGRDLLSSNPLGAALPGTHSPSAKSLRFVPLLYPPGTP